MLNRKNKNMYCLKKKAHDLINMYMPSSEKTPPQNNMIVFRNERREVSVCTP